MVRGTKQLALMLAAMAAAILLASGLAVAAALDGNYYHNTITGTAQPTP